MLIFVSENRRLHPLLQYTTPNRIEYTKFKLSLHNSQLPTANRSPKQLHLHLQHRLGILIRNPLKLLLSNQPAAPNRLHKCQPLRIIAIRPIHAVQNVLHGHLTHQARERREGEHATGRDPDVCVPHGAEVALPRRPSHFRLANVDDAVKLEGEHFAHVADDDFDVGEGVEEAAVEEAEDVEADFLV